jgi:hypothetical protein
LFPGQTLAAQTLRLWLLSAIRFAELARPADAFPVAQEAVAIRRELAAGLPARYRRNLAVSLSNLSRDLSALCREDDAAVVHHEAQKYRGSRP